MKRRNWALVILLAALVAAGIFLNLWTPANVAKQEQQEQKSSAPFSEQNMVQRVRNAYNAFGRAREVLKRRGEEARAKAAH